MLFLILSILCSVIVGVIFKISRKYNANPSQIISFNYITAITLCYFTFSPDLNALDHNAPLEIYTAVGILLPIVFLFLALSIKFMGIAKTDAAQRLSLFIPILAAWLLFNEAFNTYKVIGVLVGFSALLFILKKPTDNTENKWIYPAMVLLGFGIVDILFKKIALYTVVPYTTSLFVVFLISFTVSLVIVMYKLFITKESFAVKNIPFGLLVGIFNFGNILCYLKAHKAFAENPSTVFAGMNMGVIVLGTVVGAYFFKEKLSKINIIGLFLALIAVVFIFLSQLQ
ncbi:multidrug transporter EmrE-like cation transporter [Flavobacterium nitrogenifigens]|uniref:Multidrug transporter EmrE-like cation transporter n=2 Tax=Flavobacterium TaxID=237 RepID=A0A7W7IXP8_9FLAO|nr:MULTISPECIES: DMT family transporter [Flavobacterium]MBB4801825.1 multidrug transporter EmrE-like cation transporter [Flavobacterium nitrogenifigens]MBB6386783.1 multidrug transporter EmrE-like cation transporter [Flavobacterium notoginsengisoli]